MTYLEWFANQPEEFRIAINPHNVPTKTFTDYRLCPHTLDQLRTADNAHIFKKAGVI